MEKIRVLVCDDMMYMRLFFVELINNSDNCICVGEAKNEQETISQVEKLKPDIVLLDVQMDREDSGIILIPQIKELSPHTKIIMISVHDDNDKIFDAIQLGAKDYILKEQMPSDILENIEKVHNGDSGLRSELAEKILKRCEEVEEKQKSILFFINNMMILSQRELEILKLSGKGLTYEQIADKLCIEEVTVRIYVSRVLKKMQYSKMSVLIKHLREMGIFDFFEYE